MPRPATLLARMKLMAPSGRHAAGKASGRHTHGYTERSTLHPIYSYLPPRPANPRPESVVSLHAQSWPKTEASRQLAGAQGPVRLPRHPGARPMSKTQDAPRAAWDRPQRARTQPRACHQLPGGSARPHALQQDPARTLAAALSNAPAGSSLGVPAPPSLTQRETSSS